MPGVISLNPSTVLYDAEGHPITVSLDVDKYRLEIQGKVDIVRPPPPPGKTQVVQSVRGIINGEEGTYTNYMIPTGASLFIQRFYAGCAGEGGKGARCILYWDPNGNGTNQEELAVLYTQASSMFYEMSYTLPLVGNGTRRLRFWRTALEGSTQEVYAQLRGYY